ARAVVSSEKARLQQAGNVDPLPAVTEATSNQRHDHVSGAPRLVYELAPTVLVSELSQVDVGIVGVAGEQLVACLAVEHDSDVLAGATHDHPHGERGAAHHGFLDMPDPSLELPDEVRGGRPHLGVFGTGVLDDLGYVVRLVDGIA